MTAAGSYVGVDVGSSGTRVIALGPSGEVQASARCSRPREPMAISQLERDLDVARIWTDVTSCIAGVASQIGKVQSLGICTMRQTLIATGDDGAVLFASGNDDLRASFHGAGIDAAHGEVLSRETGHTPAMIFWPGKLAWIDAEAPELAAAAARLTTLDALLVQRLTGAHPIGSASAAETGAWSVPGSRWLDAVMPPWANPLLPPVEDAASAAALSSETARVLGLPHGLPVAVGIPDTHAAELGSRRADVSAGDSVTAGWSITVQRPLPAWGEHAATWHGLRLGGGYLVESNAGDVASGYGWLSQGRNGELTDDASATESAAERGVFIATGARVMDPASAGIGAAGLVSPIPFVDGTPSSAMLGTAVLEDVAFAVRGNRARLSGAIEPNAPVRLTGGFASAPAAGLILANVLGAPVAAYPNLPVTAIGAALWGALAANEGSVDELIDCLAPAPHLHQPDPDRAREYDSHYDRWVDLRARLESFMQEAL